MPQEDKSALACGFCGRISVEHAGWRQLFDRSMTEHDDEISCMICPKCHKNLIEANLGAVVDGDAAVEAVLSEMEDSDPAKDYIGSSLRDFLRSMLYLRSHDMYFTDRYGIVMKDYLNDMDARIVRIEKMDALGRRQVVLDTGQE